MSHRSLSRGLSIVLVGLAASSLLFALPVLADPQSGDPEVVKPSDVSEKELDSFADAYVRIADVRRTYASKLEAADGERAKEIKQEAEQKTVEVLDAEGFSPAEYTGILTAVNTDDQLRERALEKIQKRR